MKNRESEVYILKMVNTKTFCSYKKYILHSYALPIEHFGKKFVIQKFFGSFCSLKTIFVFYATLIVVVQQKIIVQEFYGSFFKKYSIFLNIIKNLKF